MAVWARKERDVMRRERAGMSWGRRDEEKEGALQRRPSHTRCINGRSGHHDRLIFGVSTCRSHLCELLRAASIMLGFGRFAGSCRLLLVILMSPTFPCPPPWPDRAPSAARRSPLHSTGGGRSCPTWSFLPSRTRLCGVSFNHVSKSPHKNGSLFSLLSLVESMVLLSTLTASPHASLRSHSSL